ncbi:MAG: LytTR family DNA-binding domain-containing protein [Bacteroidota bacterium]
MKNTKDKIKALVIDDESLARQLLISYLGESGQVELIGECSNGYEALKAIQEMKPGLIFLDVQMPKIDGFELLEVLDNPPPVIFTTAFEQYAIRAFENNAVDYLLKPFSAERLRQAVQKALDRISQGEGNDIAGLKKQLENDDKVLERVIVRKGSKLVVIQVGEIHFLEAQDDYTMIHTAGGRYMKDRSLKYFEKKLPGGFVRVHRSYIVPVSQVENIETYGKESYTLKLKCGHSVRASAAGYKLLKEGM